MKTKMNEPYLIGLGGVLRSGKDTVADILVEKYHFEKMGMSDPLNRALLTLDPWVRLDFPVYNIHPWKNKSYRSKFHAGEYVRYRELHDAVGYVEAKKHRDVRTYLQLLGTEVGRNQIDSEVWVRAAVKKILENRSNDIPTVITAIRFENELDMLKRLGGISVWIERHDTQDSRLMSHASENSVSQDMFDFVIPNHGTLEELESYVEGCMERQIEPVMQMRSRFYMPSEADWAAYKNAIGTPTHSRETPS